MALKPGKNYTRNEWKRFKSTLETSGEDVKLHSKRVEKIAKIHSKRVEKITSILLFDAVSSLITGLVLNIFFTEPILGYTFLAGRAAKLHSKRVEKM